MNISLTGLIEYFLTVSIGSLVNIYSILGLQGWLIVLTLVVSGMSYRSQKRAGIREAIEQLDPRRVDYRVLDPRNDLRANRELIQVKAGLNSFNFIRRTCTISFIFNKIDNQSDRIVMYSVPPYYLTIPEQQTQRIRTLEERILEHESILSVDREDSQLVVTCSTTNPVECRQVANYVLNQHDYSDYNLIHREDFRPWPDV